MMNKNVTVVYYILRLLLTPIFKFIYNPKIEGKNNIPKEGAVIIACNHKHLFDQCFAIISCKRGIHYMAKNEYFLSWKTRWFFKLVGCIPVDRKRKDPNSKRLALEVLNDGGVIGIFPEGTRNKTNKKLLDFKYGAVSLAKKSSCYIVPCGISGDYKFRSKNLIAKFGKPFKVDDMSLEDANKKLYNMINDLVE